MAVAIVAELNAREPAGCNSGTVPGIPGRVVGDSFIPVRIYSFSGSRRVVGRAGARLGSGGSGGGSAGASIESTGSAYRSAHGLGEGDPLE
jgi:hypothetical protein